MLLFAVVALAFLAFCNYVISGYKLFYPAVVLCAVWAIDLFLVWCSGDYFYPISSNALFLFLFGSAAFSMGAAATSKFEPHSCDSPLSATSDRLISWGVLLLGLMVPIFYYRLAGIAGGYGAPTFLMSARMAMLDLAESGQGSFLDVIWSSSILVALLAFNEREKGRTRAAIALFLAFLLNGLTGGRAGMVFLVLGCICIDWMKVKAIRWKLLLSAILFFFIFFGVMAFFLHKGVGPGDSVGEELLAAGRQVVLYSAGGPVGFGEVAERPNIVQHNWQIDHFLRQVGKKLGLDIDVPSQHSEFVTLGPGGLIGNVYTMYFGYFDWGIPGTMLLLFVAGLVVTLIFRHALKNPRTPVLVYSILFTQTVLSVFSENFYRGIGTTLRMYLFSWVIYNGPAFLKSYRSMIAGAARELLRNSSEA